MLGLSSDIQSRTCIAWITSQLDDFFQVMFQCFLANIRRYHRCGLVLNISSCHIWLVLETSMSLNVIQQLLQVIIIKPSLQTEKKSLDNKAFCNKLSKCLSTQEMGFNTLYLTVQQTIQGKGRRKDILPVAQYFPKPFRGREKCEKCVCSETWIFNPFTPKIS